MSNEFWLPLADKQDKKAMRQFGLGFSFLLIVIFMAVLPWLFDQSFPLWPLYIATPLSIMSLVYAPSVYPIYRAWMVIASILAWINTRLIMLIAFYGLVVPLGLLLKIFGKLQYRTYFSRRHQYESYWQTRPKHLTKGNLKEPF